MRYTPLVAIASGSAAGIVAKHARGGPSLRARGSRTQPASPAQTQSQHIHATLTRAWRSLTIQQQFTWSKLADQVHRGASLTTRYCFTSAELFAYCNRNLITIGSTDLLRTAPPLPSIPAVDKFTAAPIYSQPNFPRILNGWQLIVGYSVPPGAVAVLRASRSLSPTRRAIAQRDLRILQTFQPWPNYGLQVSDTWIQIWGTPPPAGTVTFELTLIDPASGFASPPVRAAVSYTADQVPITVAGSVTVKFDGTAVAQLEDTYIQFGGETVAGGN